MNKLLQSDLSELEFLLEKVKSQGLDYINTIDDRPTSSHQKITETLGLDKQGLGGRETLQLFNERFEPLIVSSSGPRFWGYVIGGSTPASIMGDWLASIYDQNPQAIKGTGDISANIELETIQLILDLFDLPKSYVGGFVTGATMSNFTCLAVARQWIGKTAGKDFAKEGITEKIPVLTATPHSSAIKSLALLGMGSNNIVKVKTIKGHREAISIDDLEAQIKKLNGRPFILISSAGTVNTVDFDDFKAIKKLKETYNFWWHTDAAFGGFAACSNTHKHFLEDWDYSDSITLDCHKWLNVPYESAVFLVKEEHRLLQTESFQNSNAPYLGDPLENFNYLNFLPENSRRLKALPAWFSLRAYGKEGYTSIVENSIGLAQYFGKKIEESHDFKLLAPVRLNNIVFNLKRKPNQNVLDAFLNQLNGSGKVFMTPTFYHDEKAIRASFVNWRTTEKDVDLVCEEMQRIINAI
ncbi:pyridoxal phosphate-dependent decarboxylase family protein [Zobellia galactanivorans]|uniref:pyridoxal phosphate-dependent decarboxylase family protein n=1 Tax=Zobellia galactanivorans (strain DSM 12802 / CCUG 47099 / CIP 106680 / NCIMB 13871 / Dsij) TaxID=63186 RepID=UPI001C07CA0F|nr:pyridoxal-dependent decarboxylase [Zobellia galactanivorans]MBU3026024.1 aspartate aminotransferase family protein [Zobellia galactanivorans]